MSWGHGRPQFLFDKDRWCNFQSPSVFPKETGCVALGFLCLFVLLFFFLPQSISYWIFLGSFLLVKIFHGLWIPNLDLSTSVMNAESQLSSFLLGSPTFLLAAPVDLFIHATPQAFLESPRQECPSWPNLSVRPEFFVHLCLDLHLAPLTAFVLWRTLDTSVTRVPQGFNFNMIDLSCY